MPFSMCYVYMLHGKSSMSSLLVWIKPFDAHCCHMGTATKHSMQDRVKPSFVILTSGHSDAAMSVKVPGCQKLQMMA